MRPSGPPVIGLRVDDHSAEVVVYVDGELDILTAPKLAAAIDSVVRTSESDVVLDLRTLRFIDSAGLQLLMNTRRRLLRARRNMSVKCGDGQVRRAIELARLTDALGVINL